MRYWSASNRMAEAITRNLRMARIALLLCQLLLIVGPVRAQSGGSAGATRAEQELQLAKGLLATRPDSALVHALQASRALEEGATEEQRLAVRIVLGDAYQATGAMPAALDAYQQAEVLFEEAIEASGNTAQLVLARADIEMKKGVLHFGLRDLDKSLACYNAAMRIIDESAVPLPESERAVRSVRILNNIASVYVQQSDYATALPFFQQAVELNRPLNDLRNESSLNNNIGICHMELGRFDLADQHFLRALAVRKQTGDVRGQAQVLNNMGKNQVNFGNFKAARAHFQRALELGREIGSKQSMVISLESLALVQDTLGEHKAALVAHREFKSLSDSLYSADSRTAIARMEETFRRDQERKAYELQAERMDAENARRRLWNNVLVGALFFLLLTAFLLFKVMRARVRNSRLEQEKLRLESEKLEAEQASLRASLEFKDRELTAKALFLLNKNELITNISERLLKAKSAFKQENQKIVMDIVRELQASQDEHNWQEFEAHFTQVHASFYTTLQERFPQLSPNERKLCAFLRLNMSTKDISAITLQSVNSITVARSRLRKKLGIEGEEVNLTDFLLAI